MRPSSRCFPKALHGQTILLQRSSKPQGQEGDMSCWKSSTSASLPGKSPYIGKVTILLLLKNAGKPPGSKFSYRPVSLTSCVAKHWRESSITNLAICWKPVTGCALEMWAHHTGVGTRSFTLCSQSLSDIRLVSRKGPSWLWRRPCLPTIKLNWPTYLCSVLVCSTSIPRSCPDSPK